MATGGRPPEAAPVAEEQASLFRGLDTTFGALADTCDALLHDRPFKSAWGLDDVIAFIEKELNEAKADLPVSIQLMTYTVLVSLAVSIPLSLIPWRSASFHVLTAAPGSSMSTASRNFWAWK